MQQQQQQAARHFSDSACQERMACHSSRLGALLLTWTCIVVCALSVPVWASRIVPGSATEVSNLKRILRHNADPTSTSRLGPNSFLHLSPAKFAQQYLQTHVPRWTGKARGETAPNEASFVGSLPASVDWRKKNVLPPVVVRQHYSSHIRACTRRQDQIVVTERVWWLCAVPVPGCDGICVADRNSYRGRGCSCHCFWKVADCG